MRAQEQAEIISDPDAFERFYRQYVGRVVWTGLRDHA